MTNPLENFTLTLCSTGGEAIIDGDYSHRALKIDNFGSNFDEAHVRIRGLTIRNGRLTGTPTVVACVRANAPVPTCAHCPALF